MNRIGFCFIYQRRAALVNLIAGKYFSQYSSGFGKYS
jgi:hypothetical protein